jgi:predicted N-acetyltransferase YhbS
MVNGVVRQQKSLMRIGYLMDHPEFVPVLAPAIWEHWREALPEDTTVEHRVVKLRQHMQKAELPIALIAHQQGEVLGTAALRRHDLEGREDLSPWLGGVFVMHNHRGKGVASMLCHAIKQKASSMGIESIYLFTPDQQSLYERLGWRTIEAATWRGKCGNIMHISTAA